MAAQSAHSQQTIRNLQLNLEKSQQDLSSSLHSLGEKDQVIAKIKR